MKPISAADTRISIHTRPLSERLENRSPSFSERLGAAVMDVNDRQNVADEAAEKVVKGELGIHEGLIAFGRADTSLKLLVTIKSKVFEAYNEIMRMQI